MKFFQFRNALGLDTPKKKEKAVETASTKYDVRFRFKVLNSGDALLEYTVGEMYFAISWDTWNNKPYTTWPYKDLVEEFLSGNKSYWFGEIRFAKVWALTDEELQADIDKLNTNFQLFLEMKDNLDEISVLEEERIKWSKEINRFIV